MKEAHRSRGSALVATAGWASLEFADEELAEIDRYTSESGINLWARSSEA